MINSKKRDLTIFFDPKISIDEINTIAQEISCTYGIQIIEKSELSIISSALNKSRNQYNGQYLLNYLIENKKQRFFLWIVKDDLYIPYRNFVFGLATKNYGAVLTFHRLVNITMKIKESIHECGHIYGLNHCKNNCVMQYSNSFNEAMNKPLKLCQKCLQSLVTNIDKLHD